jgi:chromosome segregation protein
MFALEEMREYEERSKFLGAQYSDLTKAQRSLRDVIGRINRKSRDLFQQTFDAVREKFRDLFRKLFGGGKADIFLEEGVDILEAGIEVIAQPPGRESLKLSLLSGGQKAMTTIALLFAIFRAKPSPFCVLDEVDAPLDDANVDRFNTILREYTDTTQFIVITHNKATMGYAGALYGVTMQEPGVSRKISIRLEDVDDDMRIKPQALDQIDQEGPFAKREKAA